MPYRVHKKRRLVEVNGDVDMGIVYDKVKGAGGPQGWTIRTYLTPEQVNAIAEALSVGEDEDDAAETSGLRTIGFRQPSDYQVFGENNLLTPAEDD